MDGANILKIINRNTPNKVGVLKASEDVSGPKGQECIVVIERAAHESRALEFKDPGGENRQFIRNTLRNIPYSEIPK